jgi:hypothetical protein
MLGRGVGIIPVNVFLSGGEIVRRFWCSLCSSYLFWTSIVRVFISSVFAMMSPIAGWGIVLHSRLTILWIHCYNQTIWKHLKCLQVAGLLMSISALTSLAWHSKRTIHTRVSCYAQEVMQKWKVSKMTARGKKTSRFQLKWRGKETIKRKKITVLGRKRDWRDWRYLIVCAPD